MKSALEHLSTYKSVHLNKTNIQTHFIGVPLIIWSITVLLTSFSFQITSDYIHVSFTLATAISLLVFCYYLALSSIIALYSVLIFGPLVYSAHFVLETEYPTFIAISAFVIGWVFQFIGHGYERAKPAFMDDVNQLLIGPFFLVAEVVFALGFSKELADDVTERALEKRRIRDATK